MKWRYRPICDRIIPNVTLSAVMRKEEEISQKTSHQTNNQFDHKCNILEINMSKSDLICVYLQWNASHWQNFTASWLGRRPLQKKIFHYALIYYYYVHDCEDEVIEVILHLYQHKGAVYLKTLEGIKDGCWRLLNGGQFSCWSRNLLCQFSEHHSQLKQQTFDYRTVCDLWIHYKSCVNLLPREPELKTTVTQAVVNVFELRLDEDR